MRARLVLDEMFSPVIADELIRRGHQVQAVAADPELRAMTDVDLFAWAARERCFLLTENVKDFRPLAIAAEAAGETAPRLLFTSSRRFPRSRRNPGALVAALDAWLARGPNATEEWLT